MDQHTKEIYSQVYSMLGTLGENYINKLPQEVYNTINNERDKTYEPKFSSALNDVTIKPEAVQIINSFNSRYWENSHERFQEPKAENLEVGKEIDFNTLNLNSLRTPNIYEQARNNMAGLKAPDFSQVKIFQENAENALVESANGISPNWNYADGSEFENINNIHFNYGVNRNLQNLVNYSKQAAESATNNISDGYVENAGNAESFANIQPSLSNANSINGVNGLNNVSGFNHEQADKFNQVSNKAQLSMTKYKYGFFHNFWSKVKGIFDR